MRRSDERGETGTATLSPPLAVLTALTQAPIGIAIFDREMRYLAASSQFLTDQGLPGDTPLVGRLHYDVFPHIPQHWRDLHARVIREGVELSHPADPFIDSHGRTEWIRWSLAPWRTGAGEVGGLVLYTEVVTPSVEARLSLEAAEKRYRAVFDQVAMGVARVAPSGTFLEVNDRFCEISGYSRPEILGLTFQQITHPEDLDADVEKARQVWTGEIPTYSIEKRYITSTGETVWINLTVAVVRTPSGEPDYFVSIIEDIGARKSAEEEQQRYQRQLRLLINELNHRVKNTLATVQSMAAQTLRGEADPAQAYGKFEARLLGLSEVHEVLTRERWHGAALREVAERALTPFAAGGSGRIEIAGPEVWLQPGAALTMALVFHELATNAVKYGALSTDGGRVTLSWELEAAENMLRLTWAERGGPPVRRPSRRGFGSRLIERGFQAELRGSALLRYEPDGFRCDMQAELPPPEDVLGLFDDPALG
ncbi:MAG TPA: PAS domain S-box protein [Phenylobacterium sp.]|nr:PAS domain S-box protein [Phenylobacterium sp.]